MKKNTGYMKDNNKFDRDGKLSFIPKIIIKKEIKKMIPVRQKTHNDCFRACMASILELPNDVSLPHIESSNWHIKWRRLLENFGLDIVFGNRDTWPSGYWLAFVPSLNYKNSLHSIIMNGNCVEFDPSTKVGYEKGRNLWIDKNIVEDCCWLEISDVSKLKNLEIFRNELESKNVQSKK